MIKDVKDIFLPFTERIRNPFFGSVAISWLIINWRILIVLIGYSKQDLKEAGFNSYIQFIESTNTWLLIWFPLICGVLYLFVNPFIRMLYSAIIEFFNKRSSKLNLEISKGSYIPIQKHIEFKQQHENLVRKYTDLINSESTLSNKISELESEKIGLTNTINERENEIALKRDTLRKMQLLGNWDLLVQDSSTILWQHQVYASDDQGTFTFYSGTNKFIAFHMHKIQYESGSKTISILCKPGHHTAQAPKIFQNPFWMELKFGSSFSELTGTINGEFDIEMKRPQSKSN